MTTWGGVPAGRLRPGLVPQVLAVPARERATTPHAPRRASPPPPSSGSGLPPAGGTWQTVSCPPLAGGAGARLPVPPGACLLARVRSLSQAEWASSRTPVWRRGFLPGSSRREAGPCLWRNFSPCPRIKRYSHARLRCLLLWAFLGLTAADRPAALPYLRVLGFTPRGQEPLRAMKGAASLPILTKPAHAWSLDGPGRRLLPAGGPLHRPVACVSPPRPGGLEWTTGPVLI